jgi:DUF1365 family protein
MSVNHSLSSAAIGVVKTPASRPSKMQLCFGTVRHQRLRPVANAFHYGVYFLRLPLRALSQSDAAASTPSRWFSRNRFNLLSFYDSDHGDGSQALIDWIDTTLLAHGISDADGEIWLQAFPRVLGYVFNPVSFWFCHKQDGSLRAVLCEVRNTSGEKHYYLLDQGGCLPFGVELIARKVFHVSPFCAIEGIYRFRFMKTAGSSGKPERTVARIEHDDQTGPLILTSISGTASELSDLLILRAFFGYPFLTLGVMLKIHWQAIRLWIKRVPFFRKPALPTQNLSR